MCLSDHDEKGANMNNRTMEYGWLQNKDCRRSNLLILQRLYCVCFATKKINLSNIEYKILDKQVVNNRKIEYGWCQNKDYVGRATC